MAANGRSIAALAVLLAVAGPTAAGGQGGDPPLARALALESDGKCAEALPLYRRALGDRDPTGALLGVERCYMQLNQPDSLLAVIDSVLTRRPRDPTVRTIILRTLTSAGRFDDAHLAFERWVASTPREATPFREYARILIDLARYRSADTVLERATRALGAPREIAAELAELRGALGMWESSARSWREAIAFFPYLEQSAIYVLRPTPPESRDSVRAVLTAPPVELPARRILAGLELRWRSAREAWRALSELPPTDSTVAAWIEFAGQAEEQEAWLVVRDALAGALHAGADRALATRAATAALRGGDAASALELIDLDGAAPEREGSSALIVRIGALGQLGRGAEAERLLEANGSRLDPVSRGDAVHAVAWGWMRQGDLDRARAVLARYGEQGDERVTAWMALYEGNLATARTGLRRLDETSLDAVLALSVLSRTRADSAPPIGAAFLSLARGDSSAAIAGFERAADSVADAAPLLLAMAARIAIATADTARSLRLWQTIVGRHPEAPEAAEAELDWARVLRQRGDFPGAVARLEHLILTYPQSALVPQARRELELAKGAIPPER